MAKKSFWQRGEDYAKKVSSEIIEQIKGGVAPWQKPWKPGESVGAENFSTGKKYSGGNSLYLMSRAISEGRGDNRWGTYNQIKEAGGQVRKGEKGTQVLFFTDRTAKAAKDEKGQPLKDKEGKTIYEEEQRSRPICKQYTVFNVEQAEGLELKPREGRVRPEWDAHRDAEKVIAASGPKVEHVAGDRAYYRIAEDKVVLPEPSQFPTRNGYYQTALHECGHSTGHPDRMDRDTLKEGMEKGFGSTEYAREELRAEISAMMTGERVGVGHDPQRGVGSGKTSACMNPFARQLLGWQAANPQMRAAALVLEVKGDFCYDIRQILVEEGREKDYIELGMEGRWQWNPLSAWWLDSYSLAYTVSSLLNQLFGKGKEPFWQQAYTNLVRLDHRASPGFSRSAG